MIKCSSSSSRILLLVLALLAPRVGQGSDPFRAHYQEAMRRYQAADYEGSVREFQAAYALKQLPRLLLNIGQAHRKLGHARDALGFYEFYLRVEPNLRADIKAELDTYIRQTRDMLAAAERIKAQQAAEEQARQKEQKEELLSRRQGEAQEQRQDEAPRAAAPEAAIQGAAAVQARPRGTGQPALALVPAGVPQAAAAPRQRKRTALWIGLGVAAGVLVAGAVAAGAVAANRPAGETTLALVNAR